ncbi:MAG: bacillithiol biosynthesis cysteine-adding enzyme BshC [Saprospiraceae bacterium]|nr:bacillithiol biosynthesis cysteine-adding enzyme BshC [Saprospiraceae bacterium]
MQVKAIDIDHIPQIGFKDRNYIKGMPGLESFIQYPFEYDAFKDVIKGRKSYPVDRNTLVEVLTDNYKGVESSEKTQININSLKDLNSFTVITAHQPSLMTGPLYYVYKILSAVKLAEALNKDHSDIHVVPLFIIGGEDHDFDEINHLHLFNKRIAWENTGKGSVGQLDTEGIEQVLDACLNILGERSKAKDDLQHLKTVLPACKNYGEFAFKLTHYLFDHLGLVILQMDNAKLKSNFKEIIKQEIISRPSQKLIEAAQDELNAIDFSPQAHAREINFFYRGQDFRSRIILEDNIYKVLDSNISWTEEELISEIDSNPQNFSPNVVMRPLFQEFTLPNLAYIGGGGEIAYWLERKTQFAHFNIHFPMLVRRTSALFLNERSMSQIEELGLSVEHLFMEKHSLIKYYLSISEAPDYKLDAFVDDIETVFRQLSHKIESIDKSLLKTAKSEMVKAQKSIEYLESKVKKSVKQREEVNLKRLERLVAQLIPEGKLQERYSNIWEYISRHDKSLIDEILPYCDPFEKNVKLFIS